MPKLWKKSKVKMDSVIEKYIMGHDYLFDLELLSFDITASRAHAKALVPAGIITKDELVKVLKIFDSLEKEFLKGHITIASKDEDCHTVIENYLVRELGKLGKKIHAGRSRNDQVLVALRLYMKNRSRVIAEKSLKLATSFLSAAEKYQAIPFPGYTHTQQAMITTLGHYYASFAESLIDDTELLLQIGHFIDKNPLGSAAGFGTSIPLDRQLTTRELGFTASQQNTLYCQTSRGKFESAYVEALYQIIATLGRFATDMLLFTSHEFSFFRVADSLVTGSSIMPQKRNLDVLEIVRGNVGVVTANQLMIKDISRNLLSGYNRDLQLTKKPLMESVKIVSDSLAVVEIVLKNIKPKEDSIRSKISGGIFMADAANDLVLQKKIPFREAYKKVASEKQGTMPDFQKNIISKKVLGAPGNLSLATYKKRISELKKNK